ncbi:MAG: glycine betaine ABC transporter substrate-binding protein [Solirubrobacterales bacterium]
MNGNALWRGLFALVAALLIAVGVAACGSDNNDDSSSSSDSTSAIKENPANNGKKITVGSKNFTEEFILGEIYSQALKAAGYDVKTDLNLGDENIALKAIQDGQISGYPEYTSTALTSFFKVQPKDVPGDAAEAAKASEEDFTKQGLVAFAPAPYDSANAVGILKSKADELGVTKLSDLEGKSQDLTLYGSPECRQRPDCLVGLQQQGGLEFKEFKPVDIGLRYDVLDKGQADLSILFTSDGQLANTDKYVLLEDDKDVFPPGNPIFIASQKAVDSAGPDFQSTIENVQSGLTNDVIRELNARVDLDKEEPAAVAADYLKSAGYVD